MKYTVPMGEIDRLNFVRLVERLYTGHKEEFPTEIAAYSQQNDDNFLISAVTAATFRL